MFLRLISFARGMTRYAVEEPYHVDWCASVYLYEPYKSYYFTKSTQTVPLYSIINFQRFFWKIDGLRSFILPDYKSFTDTWWIPCSTFSVKIMSVVAMSVHRMDANSTTFLPRSLVSIKSLLSILCDQHEQSNETFKGKRKRYNSFSKTTLNTTRNQHND